MTKSIIEIVVNDEQLQENEKRIYREDIPVEVRVFENAPYSGIKSIWYEVRQFGTDKEPTQKGILFEAGTNDDEDSRLVREPYHEAWRSMDYPEYSKYIIIDSKKNNSPEVELTVWAEDYAGNVQVKKQYFDIDVTKPEISVSYDNNLSRNGNYFNSPRTATVTIKERTEHFNEENATDALRFYIQSDTDEELLISNWDTVYGTAPNHDDDAHTATVYFGGDANYYFDIAYTDEAGNENAEVQYKSPVAKNYFTVDMTPPYGDITAVSAEGRSETWYDIVSPLTFGFWSKGNIQLSGQNGDATSPIESVRYYISPSDTALTETELNGITSWQDFGVLTLYPNMQGTVCVKITDMAGNSSYVSSNALIIDDSAPYDEMTPPDISMTEEQAKSGIHNGDVTVSVTVDDPSIADAYSGLNTVTYRILNMGKETESGTLYTFDSVMPQQSDLLKTWEGEITISSEQNNSNDVVLEIYALDNAMNSSVKTLPLSIDTTPPEISVSFDNNTNQNGLFKNGRTARISITERNFSKDYVNISATRNGENYEPTVVWTQNSGTRNGDDTVWYADVPFSGDGDYTFSVDCSDLASNKGEKATYADGTVLPDKFTVDAKAPAINVEFTDEDSEPVQNYYKAARKATITIDEQHFNKEQATQGITVKGDNDGKTVNAAVSDWTENGNTYTATVEFSDDAKYSLAVSYTDEAGNSGTSSRSEFYIDNIDPAVDISVNGDKEFSAYSKDEEVVPVITYQDTNLDTEQISIAMSATRVEVSAPEIQDDTISFTLTGASGKSLIWTGTIEDIIENGKVYGKTIIFENFPSNPDNTEDKAFDDIYTLTVSAGDKSGRSTEKSLAFSVNRFGSTYDTDEVKPLLGTYMQEASEVVISEINPNELKKYSVTLFKNNETMVLEKGKDYDVISTGEETEWHEYTYKIHENVFADDGIYSISLYSEDKAGNVSENTLDTKDSSISFVIDKTPPTAVVANLEDNETYYVDAAPGTMTVIMSANDNLKLDEVKIYLDDTENVYQQWNEEEIAQSYSNGEFTFEVTAEPFLASKAHQLTVICKDASGRENEPVIINGFKIILNDSLRPWIYAGAGGAAALIIGTVAVVVRRRKNNGTSA